MAGTSRSLRQILDQAQAHIMTAAVVLAQLRARRAIKDQLRKQGQKVSLLVFRFFRLHRRRSSHLRGNKQNACVFGI